MDSIQKEQIIAYLKSLILKVKTEEEQQVLMETIKIIRGFKK